MRTIYRLPQKGVLVKSQRKKKSTVHICLIINLIFYLCKLSHPASVRLDKTYAQLPNTDGSGMTELAGLMSLDSFILYLLRSLIFY